MKMKTAQRRAHSNVDVFLDAIGDRLDRLDSVSLAPNSEKMVYSQD